MEKNRYGHILTENFQEAVGAWIKNYSNNIAIIEGERKITYRELGNLIIRCRKFFFEQGVKKGDNIAVHMGNHSEFIMVFLSLVTMGAVPILILSAQKKNEVRGIVRVATPKLYIYDAAVSVLGSLVAEGNKELKGIEKTIFTSMLESSEVEKTKEETYKEQIVPEDLALLLLSGGTTGIPKLIPRTHGDYLYNVKRITERLKLTQESVFLSVLPMAHNFALGNPGILGTLCSGGTVVICNDIAAMEIFSLIEETKVTFTAFVPSILKMCLEYRILDDGDDISSLQQVLVGGAMLPEETARQVDLVLGGKLIQVFGTAEGLICTNSMDDSYETRVSCQGQPISEYDEIKIIDSDGKEVAQGEIGELIVKGPYTIQEYYRLLDNDKYFNEEDLYFKICEKGRENAVTPFSILLTAFGKALAKYSDNSKFLLNLPVSYRPMELEGVENLVGLCSNFILFGFDDSRSIGFLEQIEDNQNKLFSSREEGMLLSGTDVLKKVKQTKKEEIIAPVVFTSTVGGLRQGEAKFKKNMTLSYTSQVWLEGLLTEVPEGILFTLSYIKELFDEDVVNGIVDVFITILTMFGNKDKELFEMTDIPLAIRDSEIIKKLNDTTEISSSISFREKLKKNCEIYAEKYAFIDEQSHMTYQELKEFSDKLNFILLKKYSLKHGDKVGLYLPKGVEQANDNKCKHTRCNNRVSTS